MAAEPDLHRAARPRSVARVLGASALAAVVAFVGVVTNSRGGTAASSRDGVTAEIAVQDGSVLDGIRTLDAVRDETITLVVSADAIDDVHLHGYDIAARTRLDRPLEISFQASIPGEFDVELESSHLLLIRIRVR